MASPFDRLRDYLEAASALDDGRLELDLGPPADAARLAALTGQVPREWLALHALFDGVRLSWEPRGRALANRALDVPHLGESHWLVQPSTGVAYLRVDGPAAAVSTYYRRAAGEDVDAAVLVATTAGAFGRADLVICSGLAEYLELGMQHDFVVGWPDAAARARGCR
ncbi:MAG: hypothetical protein K8W52_00700 [Deltaproteobacteria bacterium]|nr:hypothetical protein [Deltaproteobacteria bacterium]